MRRIFLTMIVFSICITEGLGQITMPSSYSNDIKVNYVRSWEPVKPYTDTAEVITSNRSLQEVQQITSFFDGLGRPLQSVIRRGSLVTGDTAKDLVTTNIYDEFGRETYQFLPFVANSTGGNTSISDGNFKLNPFQQDSTFYKSMFGDETYYYGKRVFDVSPINRLTENYAPGNNWVGSASQNNEINRHGIKTKYLINTSADSVRIWTVTDITNAFGGYSSTDLYAPGQLYKLITQDEHNNQIVEFKDKQGKIILKKVQLTAQSDNGNGKGYYGWLCTYYIYDDLDNLRCVVQPKGVELLAANSWSFGYNSGVILSEQCFRYEYDERKRMTMKKVPSAGITYLIYDTRDRLIMTQDSMLRVAHKWMYTLYDALNRDTVCGLITDGTNYNNAQYHREQAENSISYPNPANYTNEVLSKKFYDDYRWRSWEGSPLSSTRINTYDTYLITNSNSTWPYPQDATYQSNQIRGMVTGTKTKVLGTNDFLYSVIVYNDKAKIIQTQSTNISGGTDINTTQYSWSGHPLILIDKHEKAGTNPQTSIVLTRLSYDDLWRNIKTEKKISTTKINNGGMPASWTTENENEYDALNNLKKKKLGVSPLETLNYEYNIRGWSLGINRNYVKDTTNTANWFGFDLGYDKASFTVNGTSHNYANAQWNGNISGTLWRSTGDDFLRKYDFSYDQSNRIITADFNQLNNNSFSKAAGINFSVSGLSYDVNGNILSMNQKGWKLGGSVTIDSMAYTYISNSNRLLKVIDAVTSDNKLGDFFDGSNGTSNDYYYDGNGNLVSDANKKITSIFYNYLNLPSEIDIAYDINPPYSGRSITNTYDALGNKLKKEVFQVDGTGVNRLITTKYINGFVYESKLTNQGGSPELDDYTDVLQFVNIEDGRARINADTSAIVYDYIIKDHLGNVRMVLTEEKDTSFYPPASMEDTSSTTESLYYTNLSSSRAELPSNYPTDTYTIPNKMGARLISEGSNIAVIGPSIALKVMAGDKFNIRVSSWWTGKEPGTPINPLPLLLSGLNASIGAIPGTHATGSELTSSNVLSAGASAFLNNQSYNSSRPKAFVNWILFDERFNYVSNSSGSEQVGDLEELTIHTLTNMPITKSGFLYIYVSNADNQNEAWFDNLQVTHIRGPLLEENHYFPFGLIMAGISSKALNEIPANKYKFNGIEQTNNFDLNIHDAFFRNFDPQIGRFWQLDPKPNYGETLYSAMSNNPILYSDFLGDTVRYAAGAGGDKAKEMVEKFANKTIIKKGKEVTNKNYNEAFANIIGRLDAAVDNFVFNFDATATEGLVSYDGKDVNVRIAEPGDAYGTNVGAEGILFEETKHSEQVLDGKTYFQVNSSGKWGASTNLQNEVEAKMFAADQLGVNKYYTEQNTGSNLQIPTQLGYLKYIAKTEVDKMTFLLKGIQNLFVTGANGRTGTANIDKAYPNLTGAPAASTLTERTKTDKIFGYPPK